MKKSYKLLGSFWDRLEIPKDISFIKDNSFINNIDDEYNIFDIYNIKKVNISYILKIEKVNDLNTLIDKMKKYNSLLINIDYIPSNDNQILTSLFIKRIKQIYCYFSNQLINNTVYLSENIKEAIQKSH